MINIQKLIEDAKENGYQGDKASAKVCQDIILKALATGAILEGLIHRIKDGLMMKLML